MVIDGNAFAGNRFFAPRPIFLVSLPHFGSRQPSILGRNWLGIGGYWQGKTGVLVGIGALFQCMRPFLAWKNYRGKAKTTEAEGYWSAPRTLFIILKEGNRGKHGALLRFF